MNLPPHGDDWPPGASLEVLHRRARLLADIRSFFALRKVLEVETPVLSHAMNPDPAIDSLSTRLLVPGERGSLSMWLHTSPEFPMKRMVAAFGEPVYQICKVFRNDEAGRWHNPEFSLLEWYRPGFDLHMLMDEVAELVGFITAEEGIAPDIRKRSYQAVFVETLDLDPLSACQSELAECAAARGIRVEGELDRDDWLHLLMSHCIEPSLDGERLEFIHDYPASQAALARIRKPDGVAERFELFWKGMELANGYHELTDAGEQQQRFLADRQRRRKMGKETGVMDERLLQALRHGMPDCSGVALGIDRLLMAVLGLDHIGQVVSFSIERS